MKNEYEVETQKYEFIRDLSGLGNPVILILLLFLVTNYNLNTLYYCVGFLIIELVANAIKLVFFKPRPLEHKYSNIKEKLLAGSFPSIHMARITYFLLYFFQNNFLNYSIILILLLLLGFSRLELKKHFLVDVIGGGFLGLLTHLFFQAVL